MEGCNQKISTVGTAFGISIVVGFILDTAMDVVLEGAMDAVMAMLVGIYMNLTAIVERVLSMGMVEDLVMGLDLGKDAVRGVLGDHYE